MYLLLALLLKYWTPKCIARFLASCVYFTSISIYSTFKWLKLFKMCNLTIVLYVNMAILKKPSTTTTKNPIFPIYTFLSRDCVCSLLVLFFFLSGWLITKPNEMGQLMAVPLTKLLNYVETLYEAYTRRIICSEVIKLLTRDFRQQTDDYRGLNTFMQTSNQTFNSFIKIISIQGSRQCTCMSLFRAESVMV